MPHPEAIASPVYLIIHPIDHGIVRPQVKLSQKLVGGVEREGGAAGVGPLNQDAVASGVVRGGCPLSVEIDLGLETAVLVIGIARSLIGEPNAARSIPVAIIVLQR